ncbi:DUF2252 domain-containing protein [Microbacterium sp. NEAU-LLC]|uniref:DUF2252 domain-containing protein n=1 Tax=Microbacterium helvum TaxID=2773713 RepID=A0ABR8NQS6_9MICO|nr:DUF2252 domain-containing protein [Microbacterium helvum]MBD3942995.1 DUF2252 domain-containing protein [Microbacterium helvum]
MSTMSDAGWVGPVSTQEHVERGREARRFTPRRSLSRLSTTGRDPMAILAEQNSTRVAELVPLRTERMSANPFAFYRATAALQAADLARDPHSGILVASCGDAHVANFGFYASPQRTLVFDLNDFDEAAWAPWEWDLKRLISSVVIAGQATSRDESVVDAACRAAVLAYARTIRTTVESSPLERFYLHSDVDAALSTMDKQSGRAMRAAIREAQKRTGDKAARKLTVLDESGRRQFVEQPPTMTHVSSEFAALLQDYIEEYLASADLSVRMLLQNYTFADIARRVVGVGSVGTRCWVMAFQDGDARALLLQVKEAGRSVLAQYGGIEQPARAERFIARVGQGGRVVGLQKTLQAFSDPFLGHAKGPEGRDFYVRQFRDMKGGITAETLEDVPFSTYAQVCAIILARAHAQSQTAAQVAGYIGNGRVAAEAILEWARSYAAVSKGDYDTFVAAN